jgi:hypothetical protein
MELGTTAPDAATDRHGAGANPEITVHWRKNKARDTTILTPCHIPFMLHSFEDVPSENIMNATQFAPLCPLYLATSAASLVMAVSAANAPGFLHARAAVRSGCRLELPLERIAVNNSNPALLILSAASERRGPAVRPEPTSTKNTSDHPARARSHPMRRPLGVERSIRNFKNWT